ncbi:MAG TPA: RNA polymerase sigma factor [Polyangia bacterium]
MRLRSTHAQPAADPGRPEHFPGFDDVYAAHFAFVSRCLRALGTPEASLEDAAQEVFMVVHRRLDQFSGQSSVRTWLFGIVRRVASNQRRAVKRQPPRQDVQPDSVAQPIKPLTPLEQLQNAEAAAFVERFLERLPKGQRDVFLLAVIEEMSIPEVAEALSIRLNTAYTWLRRARARFREATAERVDGGQR